MNTSGASAPPRRSRARRVSARHCARRWRHTRSAAAARCCAGWRDGRPWSERLRAVRGDLASLAGGMAVMLVWAGIVESFLSQYHEPVLPYSVKIGFGFVELLLLTLFLGLPRRPAVPAPARST